jgi:hypothetical protein
MSGRPHIKITESVEDLREILKQQKRILAYNKVQMLYLFQSKQVETVREVSTVLGKVRQRFIAGSPNIERAVWKIC